MKLTSRVRLLRRSWMEVSDLALQTHQPRKGLQLCVVICLAKGLTAHLLAIWLLAPKPFVPCGVSAVSLYVQGKFMCKSQVKLVKVQDDTPPSHAQVERAFSKSVGTSACRESSVVFVS